MNQTLNRKMQKLAKRFYDIASKFVLVDRTRVSYYPKAEDANFCVTLELGWDYDIDGKDFRTLQQHAKKAGVRLTVCADSSNLPGDVLYAGSNFVTL